LLKDPFCGSGVLDSGVVDSGVLDSGDLTFGIVFCLKFQIDVMISLYNVLI